MLQAAHNHTCMGKSLQASIICLSASVCKLVMGRRKVSRNKKSVTYMKGVTRKTMPHSHSRSPPTLNTTQRKQCTRPLDVAAATMPSRCSATRLGMAVSASGADNTPTAAPLSLNSATPRFRSPTSTPSPVRLQAGRNGITHLLSKSVGRRKERRRGGGAAQHATRHSSTAQAEALINQLGENVCCGGQSGGGCQRMLHAIKAAETTTLACQCCCCVEWTPASTRT